MPNPVEVRTDGALLMAHRFRVRAGARELGACAVEGLADEGPVLVRRAVGPDPALLDWCRRGDDAREDVVVELLGDDGSPAVAWTLRGARPARWRGPQLDALQGGVALEEIELHHEGLAWEAAR